jgi:hypothetical protein
VNKKQAVKRSNMETRAAESRALESREGKSRMIQKNGFLDENCQALGRDLFVLENSRMIQKNGFLDENCQALVRDLSVLENSCVSLLPNHRPKREKHSQFFSSSFSCSLY